MNKDIISLGQRIAEDKFLIAQLIQEETAGAERESGEAVTDELIQQVHAIRADFVGLLGESVSRYVDEEEVFAGLSKWGAETGNYFLALGIGLDDALLEINLYRKHITKVVKSEALQLHLPVKTVFEVMEIFHSYMDHAIYSYSSAYIETYRRRLVESRQQFLELSAPVVPVTDTIAILPIVGDVERDRARFILEKALTETIRQGVETLIIDLSGVIKVDSLVAEQISKITQALNMIGVHSILTGIRPEIAKTITMLGANTRALNAGGTLKQAFQRISSGQRV